MINVELLSLLTVQVTPHGVPDMRLSKPALTNGADSVPAFPRRTQPQTDSNCALCQRSSSRPPWAYPGQGVARPTDTARQVDLF